MTHAALLAVSCGALAVALIALGLAVYVYRVTRRAVGWAHAHRRIPAEPVDERRINVGAPRATGERRTADLGPAARHRHPDDDRSTRRDAYRLREGQEDPRASVPPPVRNPPRPVDEPETVEHAPPTTDMRRLPPPGAISR